MNRTCPVCGSENTEVSIATEIFEYKGKKIELPDYQKISCNNCGESVADSQSVKNSIPILRDTQRTIDGLLTSSDIKAIRKSLNKTQTYFGLLLGGGEKAFARYESGRVAQSKPMDNLLRILKANPDSINVLEKGEFSDTCSATEKINYLPYRNEKPFQYIIHDDIYRKIQA